MVHELATQQDSGPVAQGQGHRTTKSKCFLMADLGTGCHEEKLDLF